MIHSFTCKNFYSFCNENSVSFIVNDKTPSTSGYFLSTAGTRLSKVETVIGANASGKTNLLKILPFLKWLITDSLNSPSNFIPVKPFAFNSYATEPTELSVDFEINKDIYTYSFSLSPQRILSEELKIKNKSKQKVTSKKVFFRFWDEATNKYSFDGKNFDFPKGFEHLLPSTASIIALAKGLNHPQSVTIADYWNKIETNVIEAGWIGDHLLTNANKNVIETMDFYSQNTLLKEKAEQLLKRFDLGLEGFDIKKEKQSLNVNVIHSFGNKKSLLPFHYESSGTKQLFVLLKTILQVLNSGGVAILDEFDVNLHPEMILSLFELFIQPETNPNNAQLLFSTHSHLILSKLDKYQIVLVEKDHNGISDSWRLDEMSGVRADDNYYAKYLAGAYGAIPKIT